MSDAINEYVNRSGSCRTESSKLNARQRLRQLAGQYPGLDLDQFTTEHLTAYCLSGNDPAPNTIKARRSSCRSFFDWCTHMGLLSHNPSTSLKFTVRVGAHGVRHHTWLTESEVSELIRSCPADLKGRRLRLILIVGLMMGLRRFEIAGLEWQDFTPDLSRVSLIGKGSKRVVVGVPPQVRVELQAWRREAPPWATAVFPRFSVNTYVDTQVHWDKHIGPKHLAEEVKAAGAALGVVLHPHDLRRSYAGILEAKGVPLADISRLLRHSNIGVTSVYLEKNPHKTAALADTFELAL